jgi:hypothetical protein
VVEHSEFKQPVRGVPHAEGLFFGYALQTALLYKHGYLHLADTLCLWDRELIRTEALIEGTTPDVPDCNSF